MLMTEDNQITNEFKSYCKDDVKDLIKIFEDSIPVLEQMSVNKTVAWAPEQPSLKHLHNHYVDILVAVYTAKHTAFSKNIATSLNRFDYLGYALNARCIIESIATLKYYLKAKYLPLFQLQSVNLREMIKIHDQHLRGTRFDWDTFISKDFSRMAQDVVQKIKKKKDKIRETTNRIQNQQTNVMTCLESWAETAPVMMILYDLLCEMIHPNLGSTFLVSSLKEGQLLFGSRQGTPAAHSLFEITWGWLISAGFKEFGEVIGQLILTKYQPDELSIGNRTV